MRFSVTLQRLLIDGHRECEMIKENKSLSLSTLQMLPQASKQELELPGCRRQFYFKEKIVFIIIIKLTEGEESRTSCWWSIMGKRRWKKYVFDDIMSTIWLTFQYKLN